ncbi:MAG: cytidine deaminase, partial [Halanaerobiales bacterium]
AAYGLSNCAERTAIYNAITEGYRNFLAIAVVADSKRPVPPCGSCRQVIYEFAEKINIIMANLNNEYIIKDIFELLPGSFNGKDMK